ncbi:MAG: 2-dehydropantoate 2-reductase [Roseibacillus sp.]|nr:2-dehydropantoate 2-reductase [Roseibacillus sp.]MBP35381.1 2-dehydropantoate 2-reductase [Roseibacillus sp.]MCP4730500.1 2-dehydropantoate 2-reductase [Roseibacillus sp.]MDP7496931.1 2-dehydropantoate 2-reductase [Roseibacillus sp.]
MSPEVVRRIAIVGAGAVGGYYGGRLSAAGEDVFFLVRSGLADLRSEGLSVISPEGDFHLATPQVFGSSEEIGPVDLVIVAWKATANGCYQEALSPLLHETTGILTLQNGLGNTERLAELFGAHRVLGGLCFVCINRLSPTRIHHLAEGLVTIGEFEGGESARVRDLAACFQRAGIQCRGVEDLMLAQWVKLVWNVPFNGLCIAEGGITTADLLSRPGGEGEVRALMEEVIAGAAALGTVITPGLIEQQISSTREMGDYRPSSMIDYLEGRGVEVEAIWAEPMRRAQMAGARLPRWESLLAAIRRRLAERGERG